MEKFSRCDVIIYKGQEKPSLNTGNKNSRKPTVTPTGVNGSFQFWKERISVVTLADTNQCSEVYQKDSEYQVSTVRRMLGIQHLSTSYYGQKAASNVAPS